MNFNKEVSTLVGIVIIIIVAVILFGGVFVFQYFAMQAQETAMMLSFENSPQVIANELLSGYLDSYKLGNVALGDRIKSYSINNINIDISENGCFGFVANFSVETYKDQNNGFTNWSAGNGTESGSWVNNKVVNFNAVKAGSAYALNNVGTARVSRSCSVPSVVQPANGN